jgi:hypothetical protein
MSSKFNFHNKNMPKIEFSPTRYTPVTLEPLAFTEYVKHAFQKNESGGYDIFFCFECWFEWNEKSDNKSGSDRTE